MHLKCLCSKEAGQSVKCVYKWHPGCLSPSSPFTDPRGSALPLLSAGLRSVEAQDLLSHLAACVNIFLVASMDHVNTPLLWDKQVAARFNWLWYDVTNYVPYTLECAHVPSLLVGRR